MKTFILATIILLTGLLSFGQNAANDAIAGRAFLMGEISVEGQQDLDFQEIGFAFPTTVTTMQTDQRGVFFIEIGVGNPNVNLIFTLPEELEHSGDGPGLAIGDWTYRVHTANTAIEGIPLPDAPIPLNMAQGGTPRQRYVFLGATVFPTEENWVGEYSSEITLTVEYN